VIHFLFGGRSGNAHEIPGRLQGLPGPLGRCGPLRMLRARSFGATSGPRPATREDRHARPREARGAGSGRPGARIVAVGGDDEVGRLVGPSTRVIALDGRLAIPGFVESHAHFLSWAGPNSSSTCATAAPGARSPHGSPRPSKASPPGHGSGARLAPGEVVGAADPAIEGYPTLGELDRSPRPIRSICGTRAATRPSPTHAPSRWPGSGRPLPIRRAAISCVMARCAPRAS